MPDKDGNFKGIAVPNVPWKIKVERRKYRDWREKRGYVDVVPYAPPIKKD